MILDIHDNFERKEPTQANINKLVGEYMRDVVCESVDKYIQETSLYYQRVYHDY